MARVLRVKRGLKANLPILAQAEFGFTTDSGAEELYIGNGTGNIQIARQDTVNNLTPEKIGASAKEHDHDDRYYSEAETNALLNMRAPAYTYGTEDLSPGTSELATGTLYLMYE